MVKEIEWGDKLSRYVDVEAELRDVRSRDRIASLNQLLSYFPNPHLFGMLEQLRGFFPDAILSPKIPVSDKKLRDLLGSDYDETRVRNWHVSFFGEDGIETGLGWAFRSSGERDLEYRGTRVISLPNHILIAGSKVLDIPVSGSGSGPVTQRIISNAFREAVMESPGLHHLTTGKANPLIRV